ncbi:hypothetical protein P7D22_22585, partial [Lichenihabitans sp. Uapishka_5]|uniref:hypothetical protein n=1 Tax=Lichenihabitans sp. Uapishka_5 TaxID=3037302 RepID=UPI0029E7F321
MSVADLPMPPARAARATGASGLGDGLAVAVTILLLAAFAALVQGPGRLADDGLYRLLVALLDGHATGLGMGGALGGGVPNSFGYGELANWLPDAVLADPGRLITTMNRVGLVSAVWALGALAAALSLAYGSRVAAVATALFGLSPVWLDLAPTAHPVLPALAAFFTGAALLFADGRGWRRPALWSLATLLLFAALTLRA